MKVATKALTRLLAAAAKAHVASGDYSAPLYQPYIGLYTAITGAPTPDSVMGDITPATYAGYARQQITSWTGPLDSAGYQSQLVGPLLTFVPTDSVVSENIIGAFWATASSAGTLLGIDPFPAPIPINSPSTAVLLVARYGLVFVADYGDVELIT